MSPSVHVRRFPVPASVALLTAVALAACGGGGSDTAAVSATATSSIADAGSPTTATAAGVAKRDLPKTSPGNGATAGPLASTSQLVVKAKASLAGNVGGIVSLRVDGQVVASVEVRAVDFQDYTFSIPAITKNVTLDVQFTNDAVIAGVDRNVWVDSIVVDGVRYGSSDAAVQYDRGAGEAAFDGADAIAGQSSMWWAGALRFAIGPVAARAPVAPAPGFYVDDVNGSDANSGSASAPWKTLAKVAASGRLQAGEGIYLRCGGVWRESLSLDWFQLADGAVIAGYGSECATKKATITGADSLRGGWTKSGNVWSRAVPAGTPKIGRLFVDASAQRVARWPNFTTLASDYALTDASSPASLGTVSVAAADRAQLAGQDVRGATVQVRTSAWTVETRAVASYTSGDGALTLSSATSHGMNAGSGYLLEGKLWMLDAPGEFFHDTVANRVYVYPTTTAQQADLNGFDVEAGVRDKALAVSGRPNLKISNLALTMTSGTGLYASDAPGIEISNVVASRNKTAGVALGIFDPNVSMGTRRSAIKDSLIADNWAYGVDTRFNASVDITGNTIENTGMLDTSGESIAAVAAGDGSTVVANTIRNSAYVGVRFSGTGGSVIKDNHIAAYCARLSDCSAVYTWNGPKEHRRTVNQSALVEGNQVLDVVPNTRGAANGSTNLVAGIYLDDYTTGVTIRGNRVSGVTHGIFLHNTSNTTVTQNAVWFSSFAAITAAMDDAESDFMTGNVFSDNELMRPVVSAGVYPNLPVTNPARLINYYHRHLGSDSITNGANVFRNNRHVEVNGISEQVVMIGSSAGERWYSAQEWRGLNPNEGALQTPLTFATSAPVFGPEIVPGGDFSSSISPWGVHIGPAAGQPGTVKYLASASGCTGGCAELTPGNGGDMLYSRSFSMTPGIPHVYSYVANFGAEALIGESYIARAGTPWDSMADSQGFTSVVSRIGMPGTTTKYEAYFRPKSSAPAQVNLQVWTVGAPVRFDNVSIKAITSFNFATLGEWAKTVHAPRTGNLSVDCAALGWSAGCSVVDGNGQAIAMPATLAAGTSAQFFRADSVWRR